MFQLASGRSRSFSSTARVKKPTMAKKSRGYLARTRLSIAIATFLAAAKRPSHDIDQLMSSSSTVEVVVVWVAAKTSKSSGRELERRAGSAG